MEKKGKLFGVTADEGCISLVPIAPTRFAIPENPGLYVKVHMDGDRVDSFTVEAGGIAAAYKPIE